MKALPILFMLFYLPLIGQIIGTESGLLNEFETPTEYEIGPVRVVGADNFDQQAIKAVAGLRQGQKITIPGDQISKAIRNLWEEELFSDIAIVLDKEIQGVVYLTIQLKPRPKLSHFKFKGIPKREADKLREEIDLFSGKTITENLIFQTDAKIRGYFREKGFYSIKVDIDRIKDTIMNDSEVFLIEIDRGDKVGIKEIEIIGATSVPHWKQAMAMKDTKKRSVLRIFKRSKFTTSTYEKDKIALIEKFYGAGLRDAHIVNDTVFFLGP